MGFIISIKDTNGKKENTYLTNEVLKNKIKNTLIKKYVPQKELLRHKSLGLFITHCGANSVFESMYSGKPMIGIP